MGNPAIEYPEWDDGIPDKTTEEVSSRILKHMMEALKKKKRSIDDDVDVVISCAGGEVMCEMLPELNFNTISKLEPKWFMGYSDNTNLSFLLPTLCDVASIYGYHFPEFGMKQWHESVSDHYDLLMGKKLIY